MLFSDGENKATEAETVDSYLLYDKDRLSLAWLSSAPSFTAHLAMNSDGLK